jgi:hypothetical protein
MDDSAVTITYRHGGISFRESKLKGLQQSDGLIRRVALLCRRDIEM